MEWTTAKTLWGMFSSFLRIGAFTIGGGYAMLPLIEKEFVETRKWVTEEEIIDIFAVVQSVPGVIAINTSIFIGYKIAGLKGAVIAVLGMMIPSFTIISIIAYMLLNIQDNEYVQRVFGGVRAGVTALIGLAAFKLGRKILNGTLAIMIGSGAFLCLVLFDLHPIWVIIGAGLIGLSTLAGIKRGTE